jgi:peptide/nickel transport system permease protein
LRLAEDLVPGSAAALTKRPRYRLHASPLVPTILLLAIVLAAVFADHIAGYSPLQIDLPQRLAPPVVVGGNWAHPLGTDELGRDILTRLIYAARVSLSLAAVSLLIGSSFGTAVGVLAGYVGGWVDALLMRTADLTISYPAILLALLLASAVGPNATNVVLVVSFILWARIAKVVRGDVLVTRTRPYVELARIAGASPVRIILVHILPNVAGTVLALVSINTGQVILIEAALSFIGAGVPLPAPAWGSMTALGTDYLLTAWWLTALPALAIMITVLTVNVLGDWIRDQLDPRLVQI